LLLEITEQNICVNIDLFIDVEEENQLDAKITVY
jgi:hypothetical protein